MCILAQRPESQQETGRTQTSAEVVFIFSRLWEGGTLLRKGAP